MAPRRSRPAPYLGAAVRAAVGMSGHVPEGGR